jgi:hypothetical protein
MKQKVGRTRGFDDGIYILQIMKSDNKWGTWHSQIDQNLNANPARQALVTTLLNVQSLNVEVDVFGQVKIAAHEYPHGAIRIWTGKPETSQSEDFIWTQKR